MYESCTIHESYPGLEKSEMNDTTSLEHSPNKILFAYDCESILLYENQIGCIRDSAEREANWDIPTAMSLETFVRGAVSTPEQSIYYSDTRVSSTQSAEKTDLVTQTLFKEPLQLQLAMRQRRENYIFESSNNLKKLSFVSKIIPRFYSFFVWLDL